MSKANTTNQTSSVMEKSEADKIGAYNRGLFDGQKISMDELAQLRTALAEKQELVDLVCSQEPCPKCGYGVTGACYGCEIKQLKAELDTLQASRNRLIDNYKKLEAELAAAKELSQIKEKYIKQEAIRLDGIITKVGKLVVANTQQKADLKLCKADIELRKDYESYLQSTTKPMYSYNSWKKQQSQKGE